MKDNKVDCYTPKKMKHRLISHDRIKHKREQKKLKQEQKEQKMAPNALEKLQRIKRAQASYWNQSQTLKNETIVLN